MASPVGCSTTVAPLLLTEAGTERKAGVWVWWPVTPEGQEPLDHLGSRAPPTSTARRLQLLLFHDHNMRLHGFLRDQRILAGLGRRLANEICHRAKISPFADDRQARRRSTTSKKVASLEAIDSVPSSTSRLRWPTKAGPRTT